MKDRNLTKLGRLFIALLLLLAFISPWRSMPLLAAPNPIVVENQNTGTTTWRINYDTGDVADDVNGQIKGYASTTSLNKGDSVNFYISVNPTQTYTIDVYRLGWYNGKGGRLLKHVGPLLGHQQADCPPDPQTGLIECHWALAYTLAVPTSWTTGLYLVKLTNAANYQSYIIFTVRDDSRVADFLYQQPVTTYQAYNNYPADNLTGKSLYDYNSYGATTGLGTQRAVKVSFDRPYGGNGGFDGGGQLANDQWWERYFISWAEQQGYDISYTTDIDTHSNGTRLLNYKGFLSVGHDEYWSKPMFDAAEAARDAGVNLAFFGGNPVYWQIRLEASSSGAPNRIITCYKNAAFDPITNTALKTIRWRDNNRAEQTLVGVQFVIDGPFSTTDPYIVQNSTNWVWSGSGFADGSVVTGLTGYEVDKLFSTYPTPVSLSYNTLSSSPYQGYVAESSIYQAPSAAWVFAAGTMSWSWGLGRSGYSSAGIQQATKNILDRFLSGTATSTPTATATNPATVTPSPTPSPTNTALSTPTPTNTATATSTPTAIKPTNTPTATSTPTATNPPLPTNTATATKTATQTPTATKTIAATFTPTSSATATAKATSTATKTPSPVNTSTPTASPISTPAVNATPKPLPPTATATVLVSTVTPTALATATPTNVELSTNTPTPTATSSLTEATPIAPSAQSLFLPIIRNGGLPNKELSGQTTATTHQLFLPVILTSGDGTKADKSP